MINETWESVPEQTLKRSWRKLEPYFENVDQSNDSGSVTVTELNELLKQISDSGNCEEDDVSTWLDYDADDAGFQLMSRGGPRQFYQPGKKTIWRPPPKQNSFLNSVISVF
ncbi:hypothetical protein AVEN_272979-1 [Araneus ventricosus]|uniref:DDE-1 domain-containing protein n=1 Tax=Araneus ventricosus TaxID=182803 RepID=A0A4Y2IEH7_ARAVE|nr:hypothetical protein AVEN_272979-1 [Araneus ventricosus]